MKVKYEIITVTPKKAEQLLAFNTYPAQRPIRRSHVESLIEKQKDGRFHLADLALLKTPSTTLLMNGQHTLTACVESGATIKAALQTFEQNGESPVEIARVFSQFDGHRPRNLKDVASIYAVEIGWADWPKSVIRLCAASLAAISQEKYADSFTKASQTRLTNDQQAELMIHNKKSCEFIYSILGFGDAKKMRHMLRIPVVAAMIQTHRKSADDAAIFWTAVRDGELLRASSAEYILREFLRSTKERIVKGGQETVVAPHVIHRQCVILWNSMRTKTPPPRKVYKNAETPKVK